MLGLGHKLNKTPYWSPTSRQINNFVRRVNTDGGEVNNLIGVREILKEHPNAKLIITPSGTFTGSFPAILPNDGSGDFDYVQNTDNGTIINKDGLIESVPANTPRITWVDGVPLILVQNGQTNLFKNSDPSAGGGNVTFAHNDWGIGLTNKAIFDNQGGTVNSILFDADVVVGNDYTIAGFVKMQDGSQPVLGVSSGQDFSFRIGNNFAIGPQYKQLSNDVWFVWGSAEALTTATGVFKRDVNSTKVAEISGLMVYDGVVVPSPESYILTSGGTATRNDDIYNGTPPAGTTEILEYLSDGSINTINTIPATYQSGPGLYKYIVMK